MKLVKNTHTGEIHVFTRYFHPVIAGMEINILNTYTSFVKRGWRVTIHTTKDFPGKKVYLKDKEQVRGLYVMRYPRISYFLKVLDGQIYKEGNILMLHDLDISGHFSIYVKCLIKKLFGAKNFTIVFSSHGLFGYDRNIYPGLKMRIRDLIQNSIGVFLINKSVDGVRAVSYSEFQNLRKKGISSEIVTITNGLELEAFLPNNTSVSKKIKDFVIKNPKFVVQVARIDRVKNFEVVIEAISLLPQDVKYLIVGADGDVGYKQELNELIEKLGVNQKVLFWGAVTGASKYYLLKKALVMVHLSRAEGFGNSVHEALSQGTVCIVPNKGALTELVKDNINGFQVKNTDPKNVAKKIAFLLDERNKEKIKEIRRINKKSHYNCSWENVASRLEEYILQVSGELEKGTTEKKFAYV